MKEKLPYVSPEIQVHYINLEYGVAAGSIPLSPDDVDPYIEEWQLEKTMEKELEF